MPLPATSAAASAWKSTVPLAGVTYLTWTFGCVRFQSWTAGFVFAHDQNVIVTFCCFEPAAAATAAVAATTEIAASKTASRRPRERAPDDAGMALPFTACGGYRLLTRVTWLVTVQRRSAKVKPCAQSPQRVILCG